jgi:hypothetical protein
MRRRLCLEWGSRITTDADGIPNLTFVVAAMRTKRPCFGARLNAILYL